MCETWEIEVNVLLHFHSIEDASILRSVGLVKHPQVMSCIYITLFLVTMLIIAQQVVIFILSLFNFSPIFVPSENQIKNRNVQIESLHVVCLFNGNSFNSFLHCLL